jgi:soluble lytic murein transglycosylase-like protein
LALVRLRGVRFGGGALMWETEITQASQRYGVPEEWIRAVIETESSWNPNAYRYEEKIKDASYGLMQILGRTAIGLGFEGDVYHDLYDPALNIDLGTMDLAQLIKSYGTDFRRVYSAYNSGNPDLWQTSTQVAANVARAAANLEKWTTTTPAGAGTLLLLIAFGVWLLNRK